MDYFQDVAPASTPEQIASKTLLNLNAGSFIWARARINSVKHDSLNLRLQSIVAYRLEDSLRHVMPCGWEHFGCFHDALFALICNVNSEPLNTSKSLSDARYLLGIPGM